MFTFCYCFLLVKIRRTVTNADGAFTLDTNLKGVAKISYVGYHETNYTIISFKWYNKKWKPYVVKLHEVTRTQ